MMLMVDKDLPKKLERYRMLMKEPKKHQIEIRELSKELIDTMEAELGVEGLL